MKIFTQKGDSKFKKKKLQYLYNLILLNMTINLLSILHFHLHFIYFVVGCLLQSSRLQPHISIVSLWSCQKRKKKKLSILLKLLISIFTFYECVIQYSHSTPQVSSSTISSNFWVEIISFFSPVELKITFDGKMVGFKQWIRDCLL